MEYDSHTEQLTVRGPEHARLVLQALGVSYANNPKVEHPDYTYIVRRDEFGPVIGSLDHAYIRDIRGVYDHTEARLLSDALYNILMEPYRASRRVASPPDDQVY